MTFIWMSGRLVGLMMVTTLLLALIILPAGEADVVLGLLRPKCWGGGTLGGPDWQWVLWDRSKLSLANGIGGLALGNGLHLKV